MRRTIILFFMLLTVAFVYGKSIEVLEENEDYLILKFQIPQYSFQPYTHENETFQKIICDEGEFLSQEGFPKLPCFSEIVGLPVDGEIDFEILEKSQIVKNNILVYPNLKTVIPENFTEGMAPDAVFYKDPIAYNSSEYYPRNILSKGKSAFIGDRNFIGFKVNPFQYQADAKNLLITTSLVFKINIYGNKEETRGWENSSNFIDKIGDSFFLNNKYSKKWRKQKVKSDFVPTRPNGLVDEIQILVDEDGIYKISYDDLVSSLQNYAEENEIEFEMAFNWDTVNPRYLELYDENGTIPIRFVGEMDNSFDEGDYFEFYGKRHSGETDYYDDYTSENVYVLKLTDHLGSRMAVENGGLLVTDESQYTIPQSYKQTLHFEKEYIYNPLGAQFYYLDDYGISDFYKEDLYFWDKIDSPNLKIYSFELQYPHNIGIKYYDAKVSLFGSTYSENLNVINHHATVRINSELIDDEYWSGQTEKIFINQSGIPNDRLNDGINYLYVSLPGIPGVENEQVLMNYFEISYWREYRTNEDFIKFTWPQDKPFGLFQFELANFSSPDISVYKIGSSIMENVEIKSFYEAGGAPYYASFQDSVLSADIEYYAVTESQKKLPLQIRPNILPQLSTNSYSLLDPSNSADLLIITASRFVNSEGTLLFKQIWEEQGHTVEIIDLQDIYDEFNFGIESAEAIKDFLSYVYNNWSSPYLTHVLLLGDGISDERDNSPQREFNIIPIHKIWAQELGAIASDNWYACIVGDDVVPDIALSRITVWKEEQILDMAEKTQHYLDNPNFNDLWHSCVTFCAGGKDTDEHADFAFQSERIIKTWIPPDFNVKRIYTRLDYLPSEFSGNTIKLKNTIDNGTIYVQFMGHGSGHQWADYNLFTIDDIPTLNNDNYPLVVSLSCYASAFNHSQINSISEKLLMTPNRGGISTIGFTGFGYVSIDELFGKYLIETLFNRRITNISQALNVVKAKFYSHEQSVYGIPYSVRALVEGSVVLGDPLISFVLPTEQKEISLNKYYLQDGDILTMSSQVGDDIIRGKFVIYDENDVQIPLTDYIPIELPVNDGLLTSQNINDYIVHITDDSIFTRKVKVFAYSDEKEITGITEFSVGEANYTNLLIDPLQPTYMDSINISADFFDENGIDSILCNVKVWEYYYDPFNSSESSASENYDIQMINTDFDNYTLQSKIKPYSPGYQILYNFHIYNSEGDSTVTDNKYLRILGPDLEILDFKINEYENEPVAAVLVKNVGSYHSENCQIKLYNYFSGNLINEQQFLPLAPMEQRWVYIPIAIINGNIKYKVAVNENLECFPEIKSNNNYLNSDVFELCMFKAGVYETEATSLDDNLSVTFPGNLLSGQTIFYINNLGTLQPLNEPDIDDVCLLDNNFSNAYEIGLFNEELLADTLGHFPNNGKITLKFHYNPADSLMQLWENEGYLYVYRWNKYYSKWIKVGGEIDSQNNSVVYEVDRIGTYTIFRNNDRKPPEISANVEGQEFEHTQPILGEGGYVSQDGIISFLLTDTNGIDMLEHDILLTLSDGLNVTEIDKEDYTISVAPGHLISVPIKYSLNLDEGDYLLTLDCLDINGNYNSKTISFQVNKGLDIINIANYPNPVTSLTEDPNNEGRTRFTYVLTDKLDIAKGDKLILEIFTVSGRLVKTFDLSEHAGIGYHEFPRTALGWDCRDDDGFYLANGVYFYRFTAKKGGKTVVKTNKMAILK